MASAVEETATSVKFGSLGIGIEEVYGLTPDTLRARFGGNYSNIGQPGSHTAAGVPFGMEADFKSLDALLDYHPFKNDFRLTAGLYLNLNDYSLTANPSAGGYRLNGTVYPAASVGQLQGKLTFSKAAPYLGLGWGDALGINQRLTLMLDAGLLYQGRGSLSLSGSAVNGSDAALAQDLEAFRQQAQGGFSSMRWLPVLNGGLAYKW